ncbi:MAG: tetratricopeptide repeat protein [Spirochaetota bacterium]
MKKCSLSILLTILLIPAFLAAESYQGQIEKSMKLMKTDPENAREILNSAIESHPDLGPAYIVKGFLHLSIDKEPVKAGVEFKRGITLVKDKDEKQTYLNLIDKFTAGFNNRDEFILYKKAHQAVKQNRPSEAVGYMKKALKSNKSNYRLYYEMGYAHIELNKFKKAIHYFEEGRKINPVSRALLDELKYSYSHLGNMGKLQEIIVDIKNIYGDNPELNMELAFCQYKQKDTDLAMNTLQSNINKFPDYYLSYYTLAQMYHDKKNCKRTRELLKVFLDNADRKYLQKSSAKNDPDKILDDAQKMYESCK